MNGHWPGPLLDMGMTSRKNQVRRVLLPYVCYTVIKSLGLPEEVGRGRCVEKSKGGGDKFLLLREINLAKYIRLHEVFFVRLFVQF